jgi:hypothetical protein
MCAPLEGGSGRGLTKLLEVVQHIIMIWRCEKVEESWLVGKLTGRLLPKSGDPSNPNNWRGITLLATPTPDSHSLGIGGPPPIPGESARRGGSVP